MIITFTDLKHYINETEVYLPYSFVLKTLIAQGIIEKLSHARITPNSKLECSTSDLKNDIKRIKKPYYMVSVTDYNIPEGWLSFNETLFDLSMQAKEEIYFYFPYYDLNAVKYFKDFASIKIKKNITLYSPAKHINKEDAFKALTEFEKIGFMCNFSNSGNHEKVYIFDRKAAIVGSFNFTGAGIYKNNELGVLIFGDEVAVLKNFSDRKILE